MTHTELLWLAFMISGMTSGYIADKHAKAIDALKVENNKLRLRADQLERVAEHLHDRLDQLEPRSNSQQEDMREIIRRMFDGLSDQNPT